MEVTREQMIVQLMSDRGRTREQATIAVDIVIKQKLVKQVPGKPGVYVGSNKGRQLYNEVKRNINLAVVDGWSCRVWTDDNGKTHVLNRIAPAGQCIRG